MSVTNKFDKAFIAPTQKHVSYINDEKLFNLDPTQFNVNYRSYRYFGQFQNLLITYQIEISNCEILICKKVQHFAFP
jgi:hypothetical protein